VPDPHSEAMPHALNVRALRFDWRPDLSDHRDYSLTTQRVVSLLGQLKSRRAPRDPLTRVDWREYSGALVSGIPASSAVEACLAMIEHFERRATGRLLRLSRGFLNYTAARMGGDCGAQSLRSVLKAAKLCGVPPEKHWPTATDGTPPPDGFAYCFQRYFRQIRYLRLDGPQTSGDDLLQLVRTLIAAGFPIAFGFPVSSAIGSWSDIYYPTASDEMLGGAAVTAVGFDDHLRIRSDRGALLVRAAWGAHWGDAGHGWLPYTFLRQRLASDFWTLIKPSWIRSGEFEAPAL
jgi:C1A family cysteine protease